MGVVAEALGATIAAWRPTKPRAPTSIDESAQYFSDKPRLQNRAISNELGIPIRDVQRYRKYERGEPGQKRKPPPELVERIIASARAKQLAAMPPPDPAAAVRRIRRHGLGVRIRGWIVVSQPPARVHTMPAEPGPPQYVPPELVGDVMDAWQRGDHELAGDELLVQSFFIAYGLPEAELTDIEWARVEIR